MAAATEPRVLPIIGPAQRVKMEAKSELQEAKRKEERGGDDDANRSDGAAAAARDGEIAASAAPSGEDELNAYELERERNISRIRARMEAVVGESRRDLAAMKKRASASAKVSMLRLRPRP